MTTDASLLFRLLGIIKRFIVRLFRGAMGKNRVLMGA